MRYWTSLYLAEIEEMMVEGVNVMLHVNTRLLAESAFFGPGDAAAGGHTFEGVKARIEGCLKMVWLCTL